MPVCRFETSRSTLTPSLLKKSSLTPTTGTGTNSLSTERCFGQQDSWRTMMLLQAISELWLSHVATKETSNLQAGSPQRTQMNMLQVIIIHGLNYHRIVYFKNKSFRRAHFCRVWIIWELWECWRSTFTTFPTAWDLISSQDLMNSNGNNHQSILKLTQLIYWTIFRTVWTYFQKKMYVFLRHTLEHWPLDASFRLFMETWLSYIQPWRYVSNGPALRSNNNDGDNNNKVVDPKWQTFIAENLLFYTLFLQKVILRFLRVDLSSPKTSLMLYRISKVFFFFI